MFGRPCRCRRCTLEQQLPEEVAAELQAVADKAQVGGKGGAIVCWLVRVEWRGGGVASSWLYEILSNLQPEVRVCGVAWCRCEWHAVDLL